MKKMLSLFFIVFSVTLGFSQEFKLSGYINSGLGIIITDQDDEKPKLRVFGVDSEQPGGSFRLDGTYSNTNKNVGANFRLQFQGNVSNASFRLNFHFVFPISNWIYDC